MFGSWGMMQPRMVDPRLALVGREASILPGGAVHDIFGINVLDTPEGSEVAYLALGCFWGAEKLYWTTPGVTNTAVGYMGGTTPNPTYEETCSGRTGHTETVRVTFDPTKVSYEQLLRIFFENHDPTQGMRQGNDVGTQYRSAIFAATPEQAATAASVLEQYGEAFDKAGFGSVTTELVTEPTPFYPAEPGHQQYLFKVPHGYCPIHATGVTCG
nr:peptide-methionine (S)-S-oxide reductase MsrA [Propioniciclava sinopodophylli]